MYTFITLILVVSTLASVVCFLITIIGLAFEGIDSLGPFDTKSTLAFFCTVPLAIACFTNETFTTHLKEESAEQQARQYDYAKPVLMYHVDDCDVYRFRPDGSDHYFTKCLNSKTTTNNPIHEGKHTRQEEITTQ